MICRALHLAPLKRTPRLWISLVSPSYLFCNQKGKPNGNSHSQKSVNDALKEKADKNAKESMMKSDKNTPLHSAQDKDSLKGQQQKYSPSGQGQPDVSKKANDGQNKGQFNYDGGPQPFLRRKHVFQLLVTAAFVLTLSNAIIIVYNYWGPKLRPQGEDPEVVAERMLTKYGKNELKIDPYYIANNSIEQYFRNEFQKNKSLKLKFYAGPPGNGKSSALKKLVKEMREKGKNVFYINLRDVAEMEYNQAFDPDTRDSILDVQNLLAAVLREYNRKPREDYLIIIDDVNMLKERYYRKKGEAFDIYHSLIKTFKPGLEIFLISSSSSYCDSLRKNNFLQKDSEYHTIQPKSRAEMEAQMDKIMTHYKRFYPQITSYLLQEGYTLRHAREIAKRETVLSQARILSELQQRDQKKADDKKQEILEILFKHKIEDPKFINVFLKSILALPEQVDESDCSKVYTEVKKKLNKLSSPETNDALKELSKQGFLFYCHPGSHTVRRAFEDIIKNK